MRRSAAREWEGVIEGSTGHGGARITNMTNRGSVEHDDFESVPRMHASAWFSSEKETRAEEQPNEIGVGVYQIDKMELKDYYHEFRLDMADLLSLREDEIASYNVWKQVWDRDHPDLVMRVHKNVDHKDKVRTELEIVKCKSEFYFLSSSGSRKFTPCAN